MFVLRNYVNFPVPPNFSTIIWKQKIKDCRTVNLLPALAVPVIFYIVKNLIW